MSNKVIKSLIEFVSLQIAQENKVILQIEPNNIRMNQNSILFKHLIGGIEQENQFKPIGYSWHKRHDTVYTK